MKFLRRFLFACALALPAAVAFAQSIDAPNVIPITPQLVTSGQPTAASLAVLRQAGFDAVIYLAPGTVPNAIANEKQLLEAQGIEFVHVPIPFGTPTAEHFHAVDEALVRLQGRKVLVHCEVNMRASSMVFMHRVLTLKEDPALAYRSVSAVWSPRGVWRKLIEEQLQAGGVKFDLM